MNLVDDVLSLWMVEVEGGNWMKATVEKLYIYSNPMSEQNTRTKSSWGKRVWALSPQHSLRMIKTECSFRSSYSFYTWYTYAYTPYSPFDLQIEFIASKSEELWFLMLPTIEIRPTICCGLCYKDFTFNCILWFSQRTICQSFISKIYF